MADLTTLAEFKTYKSIATTNTDEDALISQLITSSSDFIKKYCERSFVDYYDEEKVEYFNGSDSPKVFLSEYPLVSIIAVEFSEDGGITYTPAVAGTDYFAGTDHITSGVPTLALWNPYIAHNAIKVRYYAGYEVIPEDLKLACMDLVQYYRLAEYNPKSSISTALVERSNKDGADITKLPAHIYRVLSNYRTIG